MSQDGRCADRGVFAQVQAEINQSLGWHPLRNWKKIDDIETQEKIIRALLDRQKLMKQGSAVVA